MRIAGQAYLAPWTSLAADLLFERSHAYQLRVSAATGEFLEVTGAWAIADTSLASICASAGHAQQLFLAATEGPGYSCPIRALFHFLANPQFVSEHPLVHYISKTVVWSGGLPWVRERELLALFGAEDIQHPDSMLGPLRGNPIGVQLSRAFYDIAEECIDPSAKKLTKNRFVVLSTAGAAMYVTSLLRRLQLSSPMGCALPLAVNRLVEQVSDAQLSHTRVARLAAALSVLTAQALRVLTAGECLSSDLVPALASLASQLGSVMRVRCSDLATQAVSLSHIDLRPSALSSFNNHTYIHTRTDTVTRSLLQSVLACGSEQQQSDERRQRAGSSNVPNLRIVQRNTVLNEAALITISDAILRSTNGRFRSPRSTLIARDCLNVSGTISVSHVAPDNCFCVASARVVNILCHLGIGAPSYSALRKPNKRDQADGAKHTREREQTLSDCAFFIDNVEKSKRKRHARALAKRTNAITK